MPLVIPAAAHSRTMSTIASAPMAMIARSAGPGSVAGFGKHGRPATVSRRGFTGQIAPG